MQSLVPNDLQRIGDEPRVLDVRLAERLEFKAPYQIRELIKRNRDELERHGGLSCHTINSGAQGGRPATEYWLNEAQAILICMRSDAPRAADVRAEIITVFQAWRHGTLVPMAPSLNEIGHLFDTKLEPVHRGMAQMRDEIAEVKGNVVFLSKRVDDMAPRHNFTKNTQRIWICVVAEHSAERCPCCRKVKIVHDGRKIEGIAQDDHFNGRERNTPQDGWLVCVGCNLKLRDSAEYKEAAKPHFRVFQDNLTLMFGTARKQSARKHSKTAHDKKQLDMFN